MDKILSINTLIDSIKFDRIMSKSPSSVGKITEEFLEKDKLEKFPFEIMDLLNQKDVSYVGNLHSESLWKLNAMDLSVATHLIKNYSETSVNTLLSLYQDSELLNKVCSSDSLYMDRILKMHLQTKYCKSDYRVTIDHDILNKYYILLILQIMDFIDKSSDAELSKQKIESYLEMNTLGLISSYFNVVKNIFCICEDNRKPTISSPDVYVRAIEILTSDLFERLVDSEVYYNDKSDELWKIWLENEISDNTIKLINDIVVSKGSGMTCSDINILVSIINSEVTLNTKFKYDELKELYQDDLYVLFRNLTGQSNILIMQKDINALLKAKVDVNSPYDAMYGDNSRESKFLKCINYISSENVCTLKKLLNSKKINFLEVVFDYYAEQCDDDSGDAEILRFVFSSNVMKNYKYLDRLIHLNNINQAQVKSLIRMSKTAVEGLVRLLEVKMEDATIPAYICSKYQIAKDTKIYNGEKFSFEEFSMLVNNPQENLVLMMSTLKKLKIKNSRVMNVCKELLKSETFTYLPIEDLCKLVDIAIDYNSLYLYSEKNPIFSTPIKNIDNLIYFIIKEEELRKLSMSKESELEFMRKRNVDPSFFIKKRVLDVSAIQKELCLTDIEMQDVIKLLNVSDNFIDKNFDNVLSFYINGLGTVVSKLKNSLTGRARKNLPLIVKAELAGALKEIKYLPEDYEKEIGLPVSDMQRYLWEKNFENNGICEADDFETIIRIGQYPVATCQHWDKGGYSRSLLSNFDTNKKIIVHKNNSGRIDTRAILRFTKMTLDKKTYNAYLNGEAQSVVGNDFGFKDITEEPPIQPEINKVVPKEELVLFLERCYTSLYGDQAMQVKQEIISLAKQKASEMGVRLVVSSCYDDLFRIDGELRDLYSHSNCYVYISKSKNGYQYLDSLSGEQSNSDSEKYHPAIVYISNR